MIIIGNITNKNETNNANFQLSINRLDITKRDGMLQQLMKNF